MNAVEQYEKHVAKALAHMRKTEPRFVKQHGRESVKYVEREYADRAIDELKDNYDSCKRHDARAQEMAEEWSEKWGNAQAKVAALEDMVSGHKKRIAHEVAARDRFRAKVAALEAELARETEMRWHAVRARNEAEAEVARLKGRRCETCVNWVQQQHNAMFDCDIEACCEAFISPDFACSEWTAREEAGGE